MKWSENALAAKHRDRRSRGGSLPTLRSRRGRCKLRWYGITRKEELRKLETSVRKVRVKLKLKAVEMDASSSQLTLGSKKMEAKSDQHNTDSWSVSHCKKVGFRAQGQGQGYLTS
jgi:hypothetical protein